MTIVVYKKFTPAEAIDLIRQLRDWFAAQPRRRVCHTNVFDVRRGWVIHDVLARTARRSRPSAPEPPSS